MNCPVNVERIELAASSWPGVLADPLPYNGTDFRIGYREIGHVHGKETVDIPFPKRVRDDLVASGRAQPHHTLKTSGWVSVALRSNADVEQALELLRMSYELAIRN